MRFLFYKNRSKIIPILILLVITVILRLPTFFLPHNNNDELIHLSLAMKIDKYGLDVFKKQQYNLFYVDKGFSPKNHVLVAVEGENKNCSLLEGFLGEKERLSHHPPALPFFLSLSHKIFASNLAYLVSNSQHILLMVRNSAFQFYACIIPFLFSLFLFYQFIFLVAYFFLIGWV